MVSTHRVLMMGLGKGLGNRWDILRASTTLPNVHHVPGMVLGAGDWIMM